MMKRCLLSFVMLAVAVSAQSDPIRVQLNQQGRSGIVVSFVDCDGNPISSLPKNLSIEVSVADASVRPLSNTPQPWRHTTERSRAQQADAYEIRSATPLWPEEINVNARVYDAAGGFVSGETLKDVLPRPPAWFGFFIALGGAVAAAIVRIGFARRRSPSSVVHGAVGVLFAAALAWAAVETKEVWSFFGFEKPPLRSQSYLLLGLALGAFDPRKLLRKLTREAEEEALTARELQTTITDLLTAENVREPFREELEQMLFDEKYVREHLHIVGRLEVGLEAAKNKVNLPRDLSAYLSPRLKRMYLGSYRRNFRLTMSATINAEKKFIAWKWRTYYEYVRNDAVPPEGPEIASSVATTIPEPLRNQAPGRLVMFGPIFQSVRFSIRDFAGGPSLSFEGTAGNQLHPIMEEESDRTGIPSIDVALQYDPKDKSVGATFKYAFPDAFRRMPVVSVEIENAFIGELEDGLSFLSVVQPTFGYTVETHFTPTLPRDYEIAVFEWTEVGRNTSTFDEKSGSARLTGWLMPGNGVCISYRGTKEAAAGVAPVQPGRSWAQRVLRWLPWRTQ